jgi:hypothetical protein
VNGKKTGNRVIVVLVKKKKLSQYQQMLKMKEKNVMIKIKILK